MLRRFHWDQASANLGFTFASGLRAGLVASVLLAASSWAAQQHELMGATRETVLARRGEPRSVMAGGDREFLFFAKEKVVLHRGVVVEVEALPTEPAPRRVAPPPPAPTAAGGQLANENPAVPGSAAPAATSSAAPVPEQGTGVLAPSATRPPGESPPIAAESADPAPVREPELTIKSVRAPGSAGPAARIRPAPAPTVTGAATAAASAVSPTAQVPVNSAAPATAPVTTSAQHSAPVASPQTAVPVQSATATVSSEPVLAAPAAEEPRSEIPAPAASESPASGPPAATKASSISKAPPATATEPENGPSSTAIIGGVLIAAIGFLVWRRRQRQLELAASAVSRDPVTTDAPAAARTVVRFTAAQLSGIDWKTFEELVAAYYGKTGVVAVRTKAGPASPVHINISWKGESRPFALVQCIAQPSGAVGAKPLQDLVAVLTAEDIRRGYVVTTGRFNVEAREYAEEKHLTLLSGDAFLDKLNALPDSARAEVMHEVFVDGATAPSCPKCEAKMVRASENPALMRCPAHPDVTTPAR